MGYPLIVCNAERIVNPFYYNSWTAAVTYKLYYSLTRFLQYF